MTERLYYTDPALAEFDATITSCGTEGGRVWVELDRTAFYPESGGQMADRGEINGEAVVDVVESETGVIRHILRGSVGEAGGFVTGRIDVERRWRHRQQHTAQHMISALFERIFGYATVSVHLGEDYGAVELDTPSIEAEDRDRVEQEVNRLVRANETIEIMMVSDAQASELPLRKAPERSGVIRVIRIGDLDWSACGGTHCGTTAEVGIVKLVGTEKLRGHVLVKFLAGVQTLSDYRRRFDVTERLSGIMTCGIADLPSNTEKLLTDNRDLKRRLTVLQRQLLPVKAAELVSQQFTRAETSVVVAEVVDVDSSLVSALAGQVAGEIGGAVALVVDGRMVLAVGERSGRHAGRLAQAICARTGLRGGGGASAAQIGGVDSATFEKCRAAFLEALENG